MTQPPKLDVEFIGSFTDAEQCPLIEAPEYAFIGRSNVGKSSMINYLTGHAELARTSKKPGKTQTINLFRVSETPAWILADLPGYGYARVSKTQRSAWTGMIGKYVLYRKNLMNLFLLLDLRVAPQEADMAFMRFLGKHEVPFCLLFTKSDQLKPAEADKALDDYRSALLREWESLPPYIVTSSLKRKGREEILQLISGMNAIFTEQPRP